VSALRVRAVIFDLWNTIAVWPEDLWAETRPQVAEHLGLTIEEFETRWYGDLAHMRETGPIEDVLALFDLSPEAVERVTSLRRAVTRKGLVPVPGAVETITTLRERGLKIGLITVCSEDVVSLWEETAFHGLFDAEVFSAAVGLRKPDPKIYRLALELLYVEPAEAVFVGDGANDELAGAERVGMRAIGVDSPGGELGDWGGPVVRELPELLELV
jgi:putative hydrolase of the HAD superfamily